MPYEPKYRYPNMYDLVSDRHRLIRRGDFWLRLWATDKRLQQAVAQQGDDALLGWVRDVLGESEFSDRREADAVQHLGYLVEQKRGSSGEFLAVVMAGVANKMGDVTAADPVLRNWCWGKCAEGKKCPEGNCLAFRTGVKHHHHARAEDVAHAAPGPKKAGAAAPRGAGKNVLGHGSYNETDDDVVVPAGVTLNFWTHRDRVLNKIEKHRAIIAPSAPVETKRGGEKVENLLLSPLKHGEAKESAHATRELPNQFEVGAGGEIYLCGDSMEGGAFQCFFYMENKFEGNPPGHHPDCRGLLGLKGPLAEIIAKGGEINFWTCREKCVTTREEADPRQDYTPEQSEYHNEMVAYVQSLLDLRRTNPVLAYLNMASMAHATRYDLEVVPLESKEAATHILDRTEPRVDRLSPEPAVRAEQVRLIWARLENLQPWEMDNLLSREKWVHVYSELCDRRDRATYSSQTFRGLILGVQAAVPGSLLPDTMQPGLRSLELFATAVESYFYYAAKSEAGAQLTAFCTSLKAASATAGDEVLANAVRALDEGLQYLLQPTPSEQTLDALETDQPLPW
ncbi:putative adhesin [Streptomyces sp. NBC_00096]|uniref:putative adhesin n=1 Tax=Streptomyces sp. NBC_00096 TaxID=2975650 RepID=UPI00324505A2